MASQHKLGAKSLANLVGLHPDIVRLVGRGLDLYPYDFSVIEGKRTLARQRELVAAGASQTLDSRHLVGMAVDLLPIDPATGKGTYDWKFYHPLGDALKKAAEELSLAVDWGGDWKSLKDGPHFELRKSVYPNALTFNPTTAAEVTKLLGAVRQTEEAPKVVEPFPPKTYVFNPGLYSATISPTGQLIVKEL